MIGWGIYFLVMGTVALVQSIFLKDQPALMGLGGLIMSAIGAIFINHGIKELKEK